MPSSGEKPMVVSRGIPARRAQRLAPLPRCAAITRPDAMAGAMRGRTLAMYSYDSPWKP